MGKKYMAKTWDGYKATGDTFLEVLENACIVSVVRKGEKFVVQEGHSKNYSVALKPSELAALGAELIEMSGCVEKIEITFSEIALGLDNETKQHEQEK